MKHCILTPPICASWRKGAILRNTNFFLMLYLPLGYLEEIRDIIKILVKKYFWLAFVFRTVLLAQGKAITYSGSKIAYSWHRSPVSVSFSILLSEHLKYFIRNTI